MVAVAIDAEGVANGSRVQSTLKAPSMVAVGIDAEGVTHGSRGSRSAPTVTDVELTPKAPWVTREPAVIDQ